MFYELLKINSKTVKNDFISTHCVGPNDEDSGCNHDKAVNGCSYIVQKIQFLRSSASVLVQTGHLIHLLIHEGIAFSVVQYVSWHIFGNQSLMNLK